MTVTKEPTDGRLIEYRFHGVTYYKASIVKKLFNTDSQVIKELEYQLKVARSES